MSIKVVCPNGHELHVKREFAGKSGLCPQCKARITVPAAEPVSEDELLAILGPPRVVRHTPPPTEEPKPHHSPVPHRTDRKPESVASAAQVSLPRRKRVCPQCCEIVSTAHTECPLCHIPLSEWTFPLPEEVKTDANARVACHFFGLRNRAQ